MVWGAFAAGMTSLFGMLWIAENGFPMAGGHIIASETSTLHHGPAHDPIWELDAPLDDARWTGIVIHDLGRPGGDPASITRLHLSRGASEVGGMGFHFVIGNGNGLGDGIVHVANRWVKQLPGAHATGGPHADDLNRHAIAICLVGDGDRRPFSADQIDSLMSLIRRLQAHLDLPEDAVMLARDMVPDESAPGRYFPVGRLVDEFPGLVRH